MKNAGKLLKCLSICRPALAIIAIDVDNCERRRQAIQLSGLKHEE